MQENTRLVFGIICALVIYVKIQIHNYLDKKNGYYAKSSSGLRFNFIFLLPYFQEVSDETKHRKTICNIIWVVFLVLLLIVLMT